jgi:hypothetical protein
MGVGLGNSETRKGSSINNNFIEEWRCTMNTRVIGFLGFLLVATSLSTAYGEEMTSGVNPAAGPDSYRSVNATVLRVVSDMVFFKTSEKTVRNTSMKELDRNGIRSVKPGDKVSLIVDRGNTILTITQPADAILFAGEITGTVQQVDRVNNSVTVKAAGKPRSFALRDAAAMKLASLKGGRVTLVLDQENWAMDAYRP